MGGGGVRESNNNIEDFCEEFLINVSLLKDPDFQY